jgi:hypothetical protein
MTQGNRPIREFRAGRVRASIWYDKVAGKNDQTWNAFSIRVEKRYKDAQGAWQSTTRFNRSDLADLELVALKAREFISLTEREPGEPSG